MTSRAPLASDLNHHHNTSANRRSTTGSSSSNRGGGGGGDNESEWGENQSAFGDVPLGLLSRRSSAVSDVNDLSELDGSVHVDESLPLDTLV